MVSDQTFLTVGFIDFLSLRTELIVQCA